MELHFACGCSPQCTLMQGVLRADARPWVMVQLCKHPHASTSFNETSSMVGKRASRPLASLCLFALQVKATGSKGIFGGFGKK